jgi:pyruvate-formate lyase-activating enzyme
MSGILQKEPIAAPALAEPADPAYYSCPAIEGNLHIDHEALKVCCAVHGGGLPGPTIAEYRGGVLPLERIFAFREQLKADNQRDARTPCKGCSLLVKARWPRSAHAFHTVGIGHFSACNLACAYCQTTTMNAADLAYLRKPLFELYPIFESLIGAKLLAPDCSIGWGGGEPTILPEFDHLNDLLLDYGARLKVHSNCVNYNRSIERALDVGRMTLICSLDAGTRETYRRMKQKDLFDKVCDNLAAYSAHGPIIAKYIVMDDNRAEEELSRFVNLVRARGIKYIHISRNMYSQRPDAKIIRAMARLAVAALKSRIPFQFPTNSVTPSDRLLIKSAMAEIVAEEMGFDPDTSWARESLFFDGLMPADERGETLEDARAERDDALRRLDLIRASGAYKISSRIAGAAGGAALFGRAKQYVPRWLRKQLKRALKLRK